MRKKILLVDDEEGIRKVLGISLSDMGYDVITAENGRDALEIFRKLKPPIVLTDIKMPLMDGITLLKKIKQENPDTEVIMLTGHGALELAIESIKLDAADFVTKPINDGILEIALKRANEKILMRQQLKSYTENLESLVREKSARLVELERLTAIDQAMEGLSSAMRGIADDLGEDRLRHFNEMPCFVSIHDSNLKMLAANSLYRKRFGNAQESWKIFKDKSLMPEQCPVGRTFSAGVGQRLKETVEFSDGSQSQVMVHTAPIRNSDGVLELVLEISADISELKRLQDDLDSAQDRLSSLGLTISTVSHAVKGMLTGLDGGIYLMRSGLNKKDFELIQEGFSSVQVVSERIKKAVLDILYCAKEREMKLELSDIGSSVSDIIEMIEPKLKNLPIEWIHEINTSVKTFVVDRPALTIALANILENAVEACQEDQKKPSHTIRFMVTSCKDNIIFEVSDDGVGMNPATQEKIFSLFFSSKGQRGTGLGLFIAQKVIEQHRGSITVESFEGKGTTMKVTVPIGTWVEELAKD